MKDIGKNIKQIRTQRNMTQDALAEALFVSRQTVSNYENGRSRPDVDMILKIAEIFGVDANAIIYGLPVPECRKKGYYRLAVGIGVFLLTGILYLLLNRWICSDPELFYTFAKYVIRIVCFPVIFFALGWVFFQFVSMVTKLRPLEYSWVKAARIVLMVIICLLVIIPMPYVIWMSVASYRSYTQSLVEMQFPYIPVCQELAGIITRANVNTPAIYSLLGAIYWLVRFPVKKSDE